MSQTKFTVIATESFNKYLSDIRTDPNTKPLTLEQELEMFYEYRRSTDNALKRSLRERLIKAQSRLVITIAKRLQQPHTAIEDLVNEGNIGLITAFDKFDPSRGFKFGTFATSYIEMQIRVFISDVIADIPQPANRSNIKALIKKVKKEFLHAGNVEPTVSEIVQRYNELRTDTDVKLTDVLYLEIENNSQLFYSLDTPITTDSEDSWTETIQGSENFATDHNIDVIENRQTLLNNLKKLLNEKEYNVVCSTYGFNGEPRTLEQIAEMTGYTRERVGQILAIALNKLKEHKQLMLQLLGAKTDVSLV